VRAWFQRSQAMSSGATSVSTRGASVAVMTTRSLGMMATAAPPAGVGVAPSPRRVMKVVLSWATSKRVEPEGRAAALRQPR